MFRNMNVPNLWTDRRGAVAVEFVFIALVLLTLIAFLADLVLREATLGKLDRVSYSVAGILRERIQLYNGREMLQQQDVDDARKLAEKMLKDMHATADLTDLSIQVEELHFDSPRFTGDDTKKVTSYQRWQSGAASSCSAPQPLNQLTQLTPKGSYGRWVPLYQLTVCLPTISWFTRLTTLTETRPLMSSFAIVMAR